MPLYCFYGKNGCNLSIHAELTYVQDDIIHAKLRLLLQPSQRLWVLVAQVSVQSNPGTETGAVVQGSEEEHIAPAHVTPTVVRWNHIEEKLRLRGETIWQSGTNTKSSPHHTKQPVWGLWEQLCG